MAQIHFDYDTDVIPKRFAEEATAEDTVPPQGRQKRATRATATPTKETGTAQKAGRRKRTREADDAIIEEEGTDSGKPISATQQITQGLSNDRLAKLQALKQRMRASADANKQDVIAEHEQKTSVLKPWEEETLLRKRREAERLLAAKAALEKGEDVTRHQALSYTLDEVEDWEQRQLKKKANIYDGFKSVDHANARKYRKLQETITPDLAKYQQQKAKLEGKVIDDGEGGARAAAEDGALFEQPDREAVSAMVGDLHQQFKKRRQHSRRRAHDPNADVNYINEKNRHFSEKLSRAYDKYTDDIRAAFERGTAL